MDDRIARMMVKIHLNKFGSFRLLASIFKMNRSEVCVAIHICRECERLVIRWHGPLGAAFVGCVLRSNLRDQRAMLAGGGTRKCDW